MRSILDLPEEWNLQVIPCRDQRIPYIICNHKEADHYVIQVTAVKRHQHQRQTGIICLLQ